MVLWLGGMRVEGCTLRARARAVLFASCGVSCAACAAFAGAAICESEQQYVVILVRNGGHSQLDQGNMR